MITVMTIAGSDPSCGAGIGADIKTFCALGAHPVAVIACVTAQNDDKFHKKMELPANMVQEQIKSVVEYYNVSAVKIGMLYSKENIKAVSTAIARYSLKNVVVDPLIVSSTGKNLIDNKAIAALKNELFPMADLITPNVAEAEELAKKKILSMDELKSAALNISCFGSKNVVITGYKEKNYSIDLLYDGKEFVEYKKERLKLPDMHGTGCAFSSSSAVFLGKGEPIGNAVEKAKEFTYNSIKRSLKLDGDKFVLNQFFNSHQ